MSATRVYAQGFNTQWTSSFQVQNLAACVAPATCDATIYVYYYNQDGSPATMANQQSGVTYPNPEQDSVAQGQSLVIFSSTLHVAPGFFGSVVIASNQPIAVVSNVFANTTNQAVDSYVGMQQGGSELYFPLVMKNNNTQSTTFTIQNVGAAATTISLHFESEKQVVGGVVSDKYAPTGSVSDVTVNQYGSVTYDMSTLTGFGTEDLSRPNYSFQWVGSVKVTATGDGAAIAGVANNVKTANSAAYEMTSYNAFIGGMQAKTFTLPLIAENNSNNRTSITCQNVGNGPANYTVTYSGEAGSTKDPDTTTGVPVNGSHVFLQDYNSAKPKFVGSAVVTSTQDIFCVVTQQKMGSGRASAYPGLDATLATTKVAYPAVQSKNGSATKGWNYTVPTLTAVGLASGDPAPWIKCDFAPEPGRGTPTSTVLQGKTVVFGDTDPATTWRDLFHTDPFTTFVGGATCYTVTSATDFTPTNIKLLGTINLIRETPPVSPRDTQGTYAGFSIN
jgi:hypothetical protein